MKKRIEELNTAVVVIRRVTFILLKKACFNYREIRINCLRLFSLSIYPFSLYFTNLQILHTYMNAIMI